ncbi:MAG: hypothetical protein KME02_03740 [Aphanothece saxicola GSE-SYN-MK-01-06B]|jgi:hypothetical protein|nr:hypothetical protein [Aphanothece saxicola GSE-SYN-MK-01-06B]
MDQFFEAAIALARRKGYLRSSIDVDSGRSRITDQSFVLSDQHGNVIARLSLDAVEKMAEELSEKAEQKDALEKNQEVWREQRIERQEFERFRQTVKADMGAPALASSGLSGCAAIVLLPISLVLLLLYPLIGIIVLVFFFIFFISGQMNYHRNRNRIDAANSVASREWRERKGGPPPR